MPNRSHLLDHLWLRRTMLRESAGAALADLKAGLLSEALIEIDWAEEDILAACSTANLLGHASAAWPVTPSPPAESRPASPGRHDAAPRGVTAAAAPPRPPASMSHEPNRRRVTNPPAVASRRPSPAE